MILTEDVYLTLLDISRKDLRGLALSPEEFNNTARLVNEMVFAKYYSKFESTLDNSETMSGFKVLNEAIVIAGGTGVLPARYYHMAGKPRYVHADGSTKHLDFVSSLEDADREEDFLTKATLLHPTCRLGTATTTADMTIHVRPTTITQIYMDYIRTSDRPILDYFLSNNEAIYTWMAAGATVAVPAGSIAMNGTAGPANVVSTTVNFEFDEEDLPMIINLFLQLLGIQLPDQGLVQSGLLLEQKSDSQ